MLFESRGQHGSRSAKVSGDLGSFGEGGHRRRFPVDRVTEIGIGSARQQASATAGDRIADAEASSQIESAIAVEKQRSRTLAGAGSE